MTMKDGLTEKLENMSRVDAVSVPDYQLDGTDHPSTVLLSLGTSSIASSMVSYW